MQHNFKSYESSDGMTRHARPSKSRKSSPAIVVDNTAFELKEVEASTEQAEELDAFLSMFRELPEHAAHEDEDESPLIQRLAECR